MTHGSRIDSLPVTYYCPCYIYVMFVSFHVIFSCCCCECFVVFVLIFIDVTRCAVSFFIVHFGHWCVLLLGCAGAVEPAYDGTP